MATVAFNITVKWDDHEEQKTWDAWVVFKEKSSAVEEGISLGES